MEESIVFGDQAGFVGASVGVRNNLAMLYGNMGLPARGIELSQKSLKIAQAQLPSWAPWCSATLARLYLLHGDTAQAKAAFDQVQGGPIEEYLVRWFSVLSYPLALAEIEIALAENDPARALKTADILIQHSQEIEARSILPDALFHKGAALVALNQPEPARRTLLEGRDVALELGARRTLWQIYALLAQIEHARGNATEAQMLREQAREVVDYIAAHANAEQRAGFLKLPEVRGLVQT
jgi:tetratricopeptide (TPR) repeat protein